MTGTDLRATGYKCSGLICGIRSTCAALQRRLTGSEFPYRESGSTAKPHYRPKIRKSTSRSWSAGMSAGPSLPSWGSVSWRTWMPYKPSQRSPASAAYRRRRRLVRPPSPLRDVGGRAAVGRVSQAGAWALSHALLVGRNPSNSFGSLASKEAAGMKCRSNVRSSWLRTRRSPRRSPFVPLSPWPRFRL